MHWLVAVLCWGAVALTLAFAMCRLFGLWSHTTYLLQSTREEKSNLTRSGIYNANGFLIKTDIDDYGGDNYHRFDIETEYPMTTLNIFPVNPQDVIPPQPLRPAPIIIPNEISSPKIIKHSNIKIDDEDDDKTKSYYHLNITNAITEPLVTVDPTVDHLKDPDIKNLDECLITNDQNDWTTKNNLNTYKKPEYTSTNPFLNNSNKINGQSNPFYSTSFSNDDLELTQFDELTECDIQQDVQSTRLRRLSKKKSFDEFDSDDVAAGSSGAVRRAISCDSVSSDTSLGPLETLLPRIAGQLCLSLRCFRINSNDSLLAVNVIEARNLEGDNPDTYVAIYLSPEQKGGHFKTKICRGTTCPSYNETFLVDIGKINKKLSFHIYNTENDACSLIGETELSLQDAGSYKQPVTTWLTLTDTSQEAVEYGELMLSLSYLPTAERLTLILTKARRLPDPDNYNIFVKVYLQRSGKKVAKKRSSIKRSETSLTFNEAFIFSVPPHALSTLELRVTLLYFPIGTEYSSITQHQKIGHIVLSHNTPGKPSNHWNQMISSLRKPVSMWHTLRRPHTRI